MSFIPSFKYNLISVYKLLCHDVDIVQFTKTGCTLQGPSVKKPVVLGRLDSGLYKLFQHANPHAQQISTPYSHASFTSIPYISCCVPAISFNENVDVSTINNSDASNKINIIYIAWHYRLEHILFSKMKHISTINCFFSPKQSFIYHVCPLAR